MSSDVQARPKTDWDVKYTLKYKKVSQVFGIEDKIEGGENQLQWCPNLLVFESIRHLRQFYLLSEVCVDPFRVVEVVALVAVETVFEHDLEGHVLLFSF